jgi:hypothetical protein
MERLELSKQKLLGPKSSASTNFATSVICIYFNQYSFSFDKIILIFKALMKEL